MKEQDIRKREVLKKYLELIRIDSERIFSDKSTFEEVDYKSWGCKSPVFEFKKFGFKYVETKRVYIIRFNNDVLDKDVLLNEKNHFFTMGDSDVI